MKMPVAILVTCSIKMPIPHEFSLNRPNVTEVGPPERTRQTVREGLNDVWVRGCSASNGLY
jgi:hypothetical protein